MADYRFRNARRGGRIHALSRIAEAEARRNVRGAAALRRAPSNPVRQTREASAFRKAVEESKRDLEQKAARDLEQKAAEEDAAFLRAVQESEKLALDKKLAQEAADRDFAREIASGFDAADNPALAAGGEAALRRAPSNPARQTREADAFRKAVEESKRDLEQNAAEEDAAFLRAVQESEKLALDKKLAQEAADRDFARKIASRFAAAGNPALAAGGGARQRILFKVIRNKGGGDCAFRAAARGAGFGENGHTALRKRYAKKHPAMREPGKWMEGCWESMARVVKRPIYVYDGRDITLYQDGRDTIFDPTKAGRKNITMRFVPPEFAHKEVIHIRWNGCHFELLLKRR